MKKFNPLLGLLVFLLVFLGLGGIFGGVMFLSDPSGESMGMADMLSRLPVPDYSLPGLFLFAVMGLAPLLLTWGLLAHPNWPLAERLTRWSKHHWAWTGTLALGILLGVWLTVQGFLIGFEASIQYVTAVNGLGILFLTLLPGIRRIYRLEL